MVSTLGPLAESRACAELDGKGNDKLAELDPGSRLVE